MLVSGHRRLCRALRTPNDDVSTVQLEEHCSQVSAAAGKAEVSLGPISGHFPSPACGQPGSASSLPLGVLGGQESGQDGDESSSVPQVRALVVGLELNLGGGWRLETHLAGSVRGCVGWGVVAAGTWPLPRSPPVHSGLPAGWPAPAASPGSWDVLSWGATGRDATFPGTVTGPRDSLPFGTEGLRDPGPSRGHHEPFRVTAGAQRVSVKAASKGRHTDQKPSGGGSPGPWVLCLPAPILLALEEPGHSCPSPALCSLREGVP